MSEWQPIDTIEYKKFAGGYASETVILWVKRTDKNYFEGPVIGAMLKNNRHDGTTWNIVDVDGVAGYDYENMFPPESVTHWMPVPKAPT